MSCGCGDDPRVTESEIKAAIEAQRKNVLREEKRRLHIRITEIDKELSK